MSFADASNPRIPPFSEEGERGVLGSALQDSEVIDRCLEKQLRPDSFFVKGHRLLFEQMVEMNHAGQPVTMLSVQERLVARGVLGAVGGYEYIEQLVDSTPTAAHSGYYIELVAAKAVLRQVIDASREAIDHCYDPDREAQQILADAESSLFAIAEHRISGLEDWAKTVGQTMEEAMHVFASGKPATGISTGYRNIDKILGGLHPSDIIILAARPAMGKTSLAMNIAEYIALGKGNDDRRGRPVAIFSLEMAREQLARRMLFSNARVPMSTLKLCHASREQVADLEMARDRLSQAQIYIDDSAGLEVTDLRSRARRLKRRFGIEFIMVDYLQLLNYSKYSRDGRQRETAAISGALKGMAKELNVPVLVLSQLSRAPETRSTKPQPPRLSDLRDSGAIEQDADVVCMLYRPNYYKEVDNHEDEKLAILSVEKHRNGPTGEARLNFEREFTRFDDRDEEHDEF